MNSLHSAHGPPRVSAHLLSRQRLLDILDGPAVLVLVQGPGGSGKTTLLAQFAALTCERSTFAWVSISRFRATRKSFWRSVVESLHTAAATSPAVDIDRIFAEDADPRDELVHTLGGLTNHILVLDELHRITDLEVFDDLITVLMHCPGLRIIAGTRTVTPLSGPLSAARVDVATVDADLLRFTVAETEELLVDSGIGPTPDLARSVTEAASGLALPTKLIVEALRRDPHASPDQVSRRLTDAGTAYLDELLRMAPDDDDYVPFLLETSAAEELTPALTARLVPRLDHRALLGRVEAGGFGTVSPGPDGERFRYTNLIRTALRAQLRSRHPDRYQHLRHTVAEWEFEFGDPYLAFVIAVDIDDLGLATKIAKSAWIELLGEHMDGIIATTETISRWQLRNYPIIAMIIALAHNSSATGRFRALEYFAIAAGSARLLRSRFSTSDQIVLLTLEAAALRVIGQTERAEAPALEAAALLDANEEIVRFELPTLLPTLYSHNGISLFYTGHVAESARSFELSHISAVQSGSLTDRVHATGLKAGTAALTGNMDFAALVVRQAENESWPPGYLGGYLTTHFHIARTFIRLEEFDFNGAATELDLLNDELRTSEHRGAMLYLRALIKLGQNEVHHGARSIGLAMAADPALRRLDARTQASLRVTAATLLTAAGEYTQAHHTLDALPVRFRYLGHVSRARLAAVTGDLTDARASLARIQHESRLTPRDQAELDLVRALVEWRSADPSAARLRFGDAVANLAEHRMRFPLMLIPGEDLQELRQAFQTPGMADVFDLPVPPAFRTPAPEIRLTRRELIVVSHLAEDSNAREIAAALFVSVNTVKSQMQSVYKKLGVRSREEAVYRARQLRLIPDHAEADSWQE
ncbi:hypothetical protein D1871_18170 [Nakamurella silvestris]|nr:hypothetical protein D1871_18170 [Nakamurella silvestris]